MAQATFATIDIGTNTTLLLVARASGPDLRDIDVLANRAEITRLGRGIGAGGRLGETGISATLGVLREYAALARAHGATIAAIGTEGLRRAPNADDFLGPAAEVLGTPVEVIDGEREAALTYRASAESFPDEAAAGAFSVVDIGGGSTEVIVAEQGAVRFHTSLPLGSVRLTERHIASDPATPAQLAAVRAEIAGALAAVPAGSGGTMVGVAGTVTSLAAMALGLASYDPERVHGFSLSLATLRVQIARLQRSTQAQRESIVGLDPRRADVILAGALILEELARHLGVPGLRVSDRGIRWGLLHDRLDALRQG